MAERKYAHGYVQAARGALVDADGPLARALEAVKDVEEERDRYREALVKLARPEIRINDMSVQATPAVVRRIANRVLRGGRA